MVPCMLSQIRGFLLSLEYRFCLDSSAELY